MDVTFLFTPETPAGICRQRSKRRCHFAPRAAEGATRGKMAQESPKGRVSPGRMALDGARGKTPPVCLSAVPAALARLRGETRAAGRPGRGRRGRARCCPAAPARPERAASMPRARAPHRAGCAHRAPPRPGGGGAPRDPAARPRFRVPGDPSPRIPAAPTPLFAFPPNANTAAFSSLCPRAPPPPPRRPPSLSQVPREEPGRVPLTRPSPPRQGSRFPPPRSRGVRGASTPPTGTSRLGPPPRSPSFPQRGDVCGDGGGAGSRRRGPPMA